MPRNGASSDVFDAIRPCERCRISEGSAGFGKASVRGGTSFLGASRPEWPAAWLLLITVVRAAAAPLFWEVFSGLAGLSTAFSDGGWGLAPPIDILHEAAFDLLNPMFMAIVVGLILERKIRLLHLGPPCSSFSMACNRFIATALRSAEFVYGLPGLSRPT